MIFHKKQERRDGDVKCRWGDGGFVFMRFVVAVNNLNDFLIWVLSNKPKFLFKTTSKVI